MITSSYNILHAFLLHGVFHLDDCAMSHCRTKICTPNARTRNLDFMF